MKYVKAENMLPDDLIKEIQKYIQGEYIYIPILPEKRKKWGENTGNRGLLKTRNEEIRKRYIAGCKIGEIAEEYFLSVESIKKIIYKR